MKTITRQKLYQQFGEELDHAELRARQLAIAQAWLAGFRAFATGDGCPYSNELAEVWECGRLEAKARKEGKL